ncbi:MAG: hypothetical protein KJ017_12700 [Alphaproteobacteria bacterium]|nr:hypothetical protein [Alphaproteobacteria bacterium]
MSNFTKSVIYSTAVLAIGLVGIMAISSQRDGQPGVAGIEPAAGESDMGVDFSKDIPQGAAQADTSPAPASEAQAEMNADIEAIEEEVIEKSSTDEVSPAPSAEAAAEGAIAGEIAPAEAAIQGEIAPAEAAGSAEDIAPASGLENATEELKDAAEKAAEDTAKELGLE